MPVTCCTKHRSALLAKLIFKYVVIRFRLKEQKTKNYLIGKVTAQRHSRIYQHECCSFFWPLQATQQIIPTNIATDIPHVNVVPIVQPAPSKRKENVLCCNWPLIPVKIYTVTIEGENHGRPFYMVVESLERFSNGLAKLLVTVNRSLIFVLITLSP